jgi:DNA-binding beta-propeller fold protein YncE
MVHVSAEELSALLDGELSGQAELRARQHLAECSFCSAEYALSVSLDEELRQPPVLSCNEVLEVLSAGLDREASEGEQAAAQRHVADCQDCRASLQTWSELASAIKALPVITPSARIDDAIYAIARSRRTYDPAPVRGIAARALVAVTAVFALVVASLATGGAPPQTELLQTPAGERPVVASIQQMVFNSRNNTLYVLDVSGAAVDAREPGTNDLKTRIQVGGEPTALALNEVANRVLVLDSSQKRVTEIDAASNTVVGATTVAVTGTPTSISVDPATNNIVVTTTTKSPAPGTSAGSVAVIDGTTKQLETVREFSVAPRLVVPDQQGHRSALVSSDQTQLVDSSYKILEILPGGVSAAFSKRSDNVAVLSASGTDSVLTFSGFIAPEALKLAGIPRALTALPDGGYLVLVDLGGRGQVSRITRQGAVFASVEVAVTMGDLIYDAATNRFTVAYDGRLDTAQMPDQVVTAVTPATGSPTPSASPTASPTAAPSATPATPAASTAPAVATIGPNVLAAAGVLTPGSVYNLPLNGIKPQFIAANGSRLWLLDQSNNVSSFDMNTGDLFDIGPLRTGAKVSYWVAGGSYVYGVDAGNGEVNIVDTVRQRIVGGFATNVLSPVSAVAVGIDGRLWIAMRDASYLFVFDPKTQLMNGFDLVDARISALTIDSQGRIYYADDARGTVGTFDPRNSKVNEIPFTRRGATTALLVDSTSTLWVGTSAGEIYSVRGSKGILTISLQRPVTAFAPDQGGRAWYLAQLPTGLSGYAYGPADGSKTPRSVSGPAQSLSFNAIGRAFLADPRGGFYMSIEGGR